MTLTLPIREQRTVIPGRVLLVDSDLMLYLSRDPDEPVNFILHSVKEMLLDMQEKTQCETMRCILSSPTNFRYEIAENYKANRKDKEKPPHYQATKDYLIQHWDAEIAPDGYEADDMLAKQMILALDDGLHASAPIIATLDKDFQTVSGWYYKWRGHHAGNIFWVNEEDAGNFLAYQLTCGDSADNILSPVRPKLKSGEYAKSGYGHVKARDFLLQYDTAAERLQAVKDLYAEQGYSKEYEVNYVLLAIGRTEV